MNPDLRATVQQVALIGILTIVVLFTNLGGPRLWDRDEPRNAGCAREMLERHDWVTPVFNGELRNHKPVLVYWLIMSAYSVFGVSEFAARFWSALLGTGTVLLTYGLGRHLFGARAGMWSALALGTSLMFNVAARAATPDSALIFFTTLGIYAFVRGAFAAAGPNAAEQSSDQYPRSVAHAACVYGSFAVGVLAKGPVAIVLPTAVIGAYLLVANWQQGGQLPLKTRIVQAPGYFLWTCWRMRPITALLMLLVIAGPWYVWVGVRTNGQFLWDFFVEHNLHRASRPMEGHDGPVFYYLIAMLPAFFPWSIFLVPTLWQAGAMLRQKNSETAGALFCWCWLVVWIGLFSLASTKLPSYITPCYPALAVLTGCFVERWIRAASRVPAFWPYAAISVLAICGVAMLIALPLVAARFLPAEQWLALVGIIPIVGALAAFVWTRRGQRLWAATSLGVTAAVFCLALFGLLAQRVDRHQHSDRLLSVVERSGPAAQLGAYGVLEPSWVFYSQRKIPQLSSEPAAINGVREFLSRYDDAFLLTTRGHLSEIVDQLPPTITVLEEAPYFLKDDQLVLLGRSAAVRMAGPETTREVQ